MLLFANFDKLCTHLQLSQCLGQWKHLTKIYCNRDDLPMHAVPTSKLLVIYL